MSEDAITDEIAEVNFVRGVRVRANDPRVSGETRPPRVFAIDELRRFAAHGGEHQPMLRVFTDPTATRPPNARCRDRRPGRGATRRAVGRRSRLETSDQAARLPHSWITHLRAAGIDDADLTTVAGHTVETMIGIYTHPLGRSHDRIRKVLG